MIKNIKLNVTNNFNKDLNKLIDINNTNNDKCFYSYDITLKHINNIKNCFNELINDIINLFNISTTNKKLSNKDPSDNINTISLGLSYLCPNFLNNNCLISDRCYGFKNERFKTVIKYRLKNYIYFNILEYLYIKDYKLYLDILYDSIDNKKDLITPVIRINQQSDIKNNIQLSILQDILIYIKIHYNKDIVFYSYSKTKDLNYNLISNNFIINKSLIIKDPNDLKKIDYNINTYITLLDKNIKINDKNLKRCKNNKDKNIKCNKCTQCNNINILSDPIIKYTYIH